MRGEEHTTEKKVIILDAMKCKKNLYFPHKANNNIYVTTISIHVCRKTILGNEDWVAFNHNLFMNLKTHYSAQMGGRQVDMKTLLLIRKLLDESYDWGWLIHGEKGYKIPRRKDAQNVIPVKTTKPHRTQDYKDKIYQMWRAKYNNQTCKESANWEQKQKAKREQLSTSKRIPKVLSHNPQTGERVSPFGTLVGQLEFLEQSVTSKEMYKNLLITIHEGTESDTSIQKKLLRLWDIHYSVINGAGGELLETLYLKGDLDTMTKFRWYEAYANKLCQFPSDYKETFLKRLYSIGSVMPELFTGSTRNFIPSDEHVYETMTCSCILGCIATYLGESTAFVITFDSGRTTSYEELKEEVEKRKVCNAILNFDYHNSDEGEKAFGVASLGVPFIKDLTEEEAAYVFATTSDVFSFNPDQVNKEKSERLFLLNEFVRRYVLRLKDFTKESRPEMHHIRNLAAKWLQLSTEDGGTREMAIEGLRRQRMNAEAMKDRRKQQSTKPTTHDTLSQTLSQYRAKCNSARPRVSDGSQSQVEVPVSSSQKLQTDNSQTTIDTLTQAFTQSTSRGQRRAISSQK